MSLVPAQEEAVQGLTLTRTIHALEGPLEHLLNIAPKEEKGTGKAWGHLLWGGSGVRTGATTRWEAGAHQTEKSTLAVSLLFPELSAPGRLSWLYL